MKRTFDGIHMQLLENAVEGIAPAVDEAGDLAAVDMLEDITELLTQSETGDMLQDCLELLTQSEKGDDGSEPVAVDAPVAVGGSEPVAVAVDAPATGGSGMFGKGFAMMRNVGVVGLYIFVFF